MHKRKKFIFLISSNDISTNFCYLYCLLIYKKPLELSFLGFSILFIGQGGVSRLKCSLVLFCQWKKLFHLSRYTCKRINVYSSETRCLDYNQQYISYAEQRYDFAHCSWPMRVVGNLWDKGGSIM